MPGKSEGAFGVGTIVAFLLLAVFIYLLFRPYRESTALEVDGKKVIGVK